MAPQVGEEPDTFDRTKEQAEILPSGYAGKIQRAHGKQEICPHCGKDTHEPNPNKSGESLKR